MKSLIACALLMTTFNIFAFERTTSLDLRNLYASTNAGEYIIKVEFTAKTSKSESTLSFSTRQDDGITYCTTSAYFDIGTMKFSMINKKTGETTNIVSPVVGSVYSTVESSECDTSIEKFQGKQIVYSQVGLKNPIALNTKAPFDYKSVEIYIQPFNGYLNVEADLVVSENKLILDPSELMTERSIMPRNSYNSTVTYYVYAQKEAETLSLGTGLVKFDQ